MVPAIPLTDSAGRLVPLLQHPSASRSPDTPTQPARQVPPSILLSAPAKSETRRPYQSLAGSEFANLPCAAAGRSSRRTRATIARPRKPRPGTRKAIARASPLQHLAAAILRRRPNNRRPAQGRRVIGQAQPVQARHPQAQPPCCLLGRGHPLGNPRCGGFSARRACVRCQCLQALEAVAQPISTSLCSPPPAESKVMWRVIRLSWGPGAQSPWQRSCALRAKRGCQDPWPHPPVACCLFLQSEYASEYEPITR